MAQITPDLPARMATYRTGPWPASMRSKAAIEATVIHELLHVLLWELTHHVENKSEAGVIESAEHRVVNTLEKLLMRAPCPPRS